MTIFRWLERELDPAGTLKELPTNSWGRSAISITSQCLEIFILFFITRPPLLPCLFFSYILNEFRRIVSLESEKFDLERDVQVMIVAQNNHQLSIWSLMMLCSSSVGEGHQHQWAKYRSERSERKVCNAQFLRHFQNHLIANKKGNYISKDLIITNTIIIISTEVCEAYTEEGVQVWEQVCQIAKEGICDLPMIGKRKRI